MCRPPTIAFSRISAVPERAVGLAARALRRLRERLLGLDQAHAAAAAAGRRLDHHRPADVLRAGLQRHDRLLFAVVAGDGRDVVGLREVPCRRLVAHRADDLRRRADERDAGRLARFGERGVLGEQAVARVQRVGPGLRAASMIASMFR